MKPTFSSHSIACDRRSFLAAAGGTLSALATQPIFANAQRIAAGPTRGIIVSEVQAAEAGMDMLAAGGNAIDAAVAAALVGCVVNISKCGIGGYGGHMVIGLPDGKLTSIDFNSAAPAAARPDLFPIDGNGAVTGNVNEHGWLAAGVPGTLAGLHLALEKYGTMPWARVLEPAIEWARNGIPLPMFYNFWRPSPGGQVPRDSEIARLFSRDSVPLKKGEIHRNPQLADMLQQLADSGSVELFYRGEIGRQIAEAFQKNGGLVTAEDMASYTAYEIEPLVLEWGEYTIATAPLTAGGLTVLQAISTLEALGWPDLGARPASPLSNTASTQAWLEALRIAWGDRLALFGDPRHVKVPVERLLSESYALQSATKVKSAIAERRPVPVEAESRSDGGTLHVSAVDDVGMMVSATLTHGNSYGAQVAVQGLGLILGHGMSRFDPVPGRPNSIAPGKRPLNNMCPTVVLRKGRPALAIGGTGGRRIPNAVFQVLLGVLGEGRSLEDAMRTPRLHTEGDLQIHAEPTARATDLQYLKQIGYTVKGPMPSFVYAVHANPAPDASAPVGAADQVAQRGTGGFREPRPRITTGRPAREPSAR